MLHYARGETKIIINSSSIRTTAGAFRSVWLISFWHSPVKVFRPAFFNFNFLLKRATVFIIINEILQHKTVLKLVFQPHSGGLLFWERSLNPRMNGGNDETVIIFFLIPFVLTSPLEDNKRKPHLQIIATPRRKWWLLIYLFRWALTEVGSTRFNSASIIDKCSANLETDIYQPPAKTNIWADISNQLLQKRGEKITPNHAQIVMVFWNKLFIRNKKKLKRSWEVWEFLQTIVMFV